MQLTGRRYLFAGLGFLFLGGFFAMVMRLQLAFPGVVPTADYQQIFTLHGLTMIFFAITPMLFGGFGNLVVPPLVGAKTVAFPRLGAFAFWLYAASGALLLGSLAAPLGPAMSGWTSYAPLSTRIGSPGIGQTLTTGAVLLTALSTLLTSLNLAGTIAQHRVKNLRWLQLPLSVWGFFFASVLNVVFLPVLGVGCALLLSDRVLGTALFSRDGDPLLYQHLFWLFGHPEVYILILPVWGLVSDLLAFFSRKPAWFYKGTVAALGAITALSGLVYGHHMYQSGLSPMLGRAFMALTLLISLPAMLMVLNWQMTLRGGALRLQTPMQFALGTVLIFGFGGVTGLGLASPLADLYLHDTMYVVGHFHLTLAGSALMGLFAALYYWFPLIFPGRALDERLGRWHFALSFVLFVAVFSGLLYLGWSGQSRRLADPYAYEMLAPLQRANQVISYLAFALGFSQLLLVVNLYRSLKVPLRELNNPWQVGTLEWMPGDEVVRGPHELSEPALSQRLGRDWAGQAEP